MLVHSNAQNTRYISKGLLVLILIILWIIHSDSSPDRAN